MKSKADVIKKKKVINTSEHRGLYGHEETKQDSAQRYYFRVTDFLIYLACRVSLLRLPNISGVGTVVCTRYYVRNSRPN